MDIPSGDTDVERLSMGAFCVAAKIPVAPNLNFPAKKLDTNVWGRAWKGHVPIFGRMAAKIPVVPNLNFPAKN